MQILGSLFGVTAGGPGMGGQPTAFGHPISVSVTDGGGPQAGSGLGGLFGAGAEPMSGAELQQQAQVGRWEL